MKKKLQKTFNQARHNANNFKDDLKKDIEDVRDETLGPTLEHGKNRIKSGAAGAKVGALIGWRFAGPVGVKAGIIIGAGAGLIGGPSLSRWVQKKLGVKTPANKNDKPNKPPSPPAP